MSQQLQPADVYPKLPTTNQQSSSSSDHSSDGSFGTVFIVLGVILAISVISCILGRFCNRRQQHDHHHQQHRARQSHGRDDHDQENGGFDHHQSAAEAAGERDVGPGIDKRMNPNGKIYMNGNGDYNNMNKRVENPASAPAGLTPSFSERFKAKVRFADDTERRAPV